MWAKRDGASRSGIPKTNRPFQCRCRGGEEARNGNLKRRGLGKLEDASRDLNPRPEGGRALAFPTAAHENYGTTPRALAADSSAVRVFPIPASRPRSTTCGTPTINRSKAAVIAASPGRRPTNAARLPLETSPLSACAAASPSRWGISFSSATNRYPRHGSWRYAERNRPHRLGPCAGRGPRSESPMG